MSWKTNFAINAREVCACEHPAMPVLDYLREILHLQGTKEGCKEGDCGACGVLVGELLGGMVRYRAVNSCLLPLAEMQGKHLVTIEGLEGADLTPVQRAIFEEGASQCGFCTPGIVLSLTCCLLEKGAAMDMEDVKQALGGHFCRCTGYSALKRAGADLVELMRAWVRDDPRLLSEERIPALVDKGVIPAYFAGIPARLRSLPATERPCQEAGEILLAGGTDLYVQKGDDLLLSRVRLLQRDPAIEGVRRENGWVRVGAMTTFRDFEESAEIGRLIPEIRRYMRLVASVQIRNRATVGGNIANASPIGDLSILLLALGAEITLDERGARRTIPLRDFFRGYKLLDRRPSEIVAEVAFPEPEAGEKIAFEKVAKRRFLDIASVNSAMRARCDREGRIERIGLAVGGVSPVPLFLRRTCEGLVGRRIDRDTVREALETADAEISPIDDVRGSARYKRILARRLLVAHFTESFPEHVQAREIL